MIELKISGDGTIDHPSKLMEDGRLKRWGAIVTKNMDKPGGLERQFLKPFANGKHILIKDQDLLGRVIELAAKLEFVTATPKSWRRGPATHVRHDQLLLRVEEILPDRLLCTPIELLAVPGAGEPVPVMENPVSLHFDQLNAKILELERLLEVQAEQHAAIKTISNRLKRQLKKPSAADIPEPLLSQFTADFQELSLKLRAGAPEAAETVGESDE